MGLGRHRIRTVRLWIAGSEVDVLLNAPKDDEDGLEYLRQLMAHGEPAVLATDSGGSVVVAWSAVALAELVS